MKTVFGNTVTVFALIEALQAYDPAAEVAINDHSPVLISTSHGTVNILVDCSDEHYYRDDVYLRSVDV